METTMRRAVLATLLMTFALGGAGLSAQAAANVGFINSEAILTQAPGYQAAIDQFQRELETMQAELQPRQAELQQMLQDYETQALALSDTAKAMREEAILQKQQQVQQEANQMQQTAQQRQAQLMQPIMDRVSEAIEAVRVEGSYALIFDAAAGGLVAADPSLDLTDQVVAKLNAMAPAPGGER
jgi:outer membrane protein